MTRVHPAGQWFVTEQPGMQTRHCFSAGPHYDPARLGVGPLIAVDEHRLDPAGGFAEHAHRGVAILSWVRSGRLRHEDDAGHVGELGPGEVQVQYAGDGIRHSERNASDREPLRFVQMTLLAPDAGSAGRYALATGAVQVGDAGFQICTGSGTIAAQHWFGYIATGSWRLGGAEVGPGDAADGPGALTASGSGTLLVWRLGPGSAVSTGAQRGQP